MTSGQTPRSHSMQPLARLAEYCGDGNPVVVEEFIPARGWRRTGFRKRASRSWLAKLRREEGVSEVAVDVGGRVADFRIGELLSRSRRRSGR